MVEQKKKNPKKITFTLNDVGSICWVKLRVHRGFPTLPLIHWHRVLPISSNRNTPSWHSSSHTGRPVTSTPQPVFWEAKRMDRTETRGSEAVQVKILYRTRNCQHSEAIEMPFGRSTDKLGYVQRMVNYSALKMSYQAMKMGRKQADYWGKAANLKRLPTYDPMPVLPHSGKSRTVDTVRSSVVFSGWRGQR